MMLKCQNCGHENLLGAIFCRNCGEKLEIDKMRPEINVKKGPGIFDILRKLVGLVIFLGLIGVIVLMFMPETITESVLATDAQASADKKFNQLMQRLNEGFGSDNFSFTTDEITYLYNSKFIGVASSEGQNAYAIEKLIVSITPEGFMNFLIKTKLAGKLPTTFEIRGALNGTNPPVSLMITEAKMGKMPIKFIESKVAEKFNPILDDAKVHLILSSIQQAEIGDNKQIKIKLKEKEL